MECNRDEAIRARDLAASKYTAHDFLGAQKVLQKAQRLCPGLEGVTQMLAVMEVHVVAQNKVAQGTEMDWYGILQVEPTADEVTVKKQYRRLALLLHPDKNKSVGAEAAFKLIGEAWGVLSDKAKRVIHDMKKAAAAAAKIKIRVHADHTKAPQQNHFNATARPGTVPTTAPHAAAPGPAPGAPQQQHHNGQQQYAHGNPQRRSQPQPDSFWTFCPGCRVQHQYKSEHVNYKVTCVNCKTVFMAVPAARAARVNGRAAATNNESRARAAAGVHHDYGFVNFTNFNSTPAAAAGAAAAATTAAATQNTAAQHAAAQAHKVAAAAAAARNAQNAVPNATPNAAPNAFPSTTTTAPNANAPPQSQSGYMDGGVGGPFSSAYPGQSSIPHFFSPAAAEAVAQSKVAAAAKAAAAATSSEVPTNNSSADFVQQAFYRVKRDRVQNKRKEKEEQQSRDADRQQEAMDRLLAERLQRADRKRGRNKEESGSGSRRKLKRKKRDSDDDDDDEEEMLDDPTQLFDDLSAPSVPRRRSSRAKKNVATYKIDASDDDESDMDDFQPVPDSSQRAKEAADGPGTDDGAGAGAGAYPTNDLDSNGRGDSEGGGTRSQPSENGGKEKGIAHESGMNGGSTGNLDSVPLTRSKSEADAHGEDVLKEKERQASDAAETTPSKRYGTLRRGVHLRDGEDEVRRTNSGRSAQQAKLKEEEIGLEGVRTEAGNDFVDEASSPNTNSKSPKTFRTRVKASNVSLESSPPAAKEEKIEQQEEIVVEQEEDDITEQEVPDPDFSDFDAARTENDVETGQIWAIYDDTDCMPRFYARINRVTIKPFKVKFNWLEYVPENEKSKDLVDSTGLSLGSGTFKFGKAAMKTEISHFSHPVCFEGGKHISKGQVKIHPRMNEVWAIFRDWDEASFKPLEAPSASGRYSYDMVLILSDFSLDNGVMTVKLIKVGGYKTLFQRQPGPGFRVFKPDELLRFAHNVPFHALEEVVTKHNGLPIGSLELDPAAVPMDLIMGPASRSQAP